MSEAWSVREYQREDHEAFWSLRGRAFPGQDLAREQRRWRWQFEDNPFRPQGLAPGWVLTDGGQVRGFLGRIAVPLWLDGREVLGLAATDWCVDPEAQGQAAGLSLARRFLADPDTEFPFATAPFPGSLPVWKYCGADVLAGKDEPCLWVRSAAAAPPDPELPVLEVERFDQRVDALALAPAADWRVFIRRDHRYLEWRYGCRDLVTGHRLVAGATEDSVRGALVWQEGSAGQAYVAELLVRPDDPAAARSLLTAVAERTGMAGVNELYLLHRESWLHRLLPDFGFQQVQGHGLGFFCGKREGGPGVADWFYTAGDGDLLLGLAGG